MITGSSNISFSNLDVGRGLKSGELATGWNALVRLNSVSNVTLDGVKIHGSEDGNTGNDSVGIYSSDSKGITVKNSELIQLNIGMGFDRVSNISIANNMIHEIHCDGMDFAQVSDVLIDKNTITDFSPVPGLHPDAIQFWTANTKAPSTDITITNNVILQGKGTGMQGIFMTDQLGTMPYKNVTIDNNLVYTGFNNGITVMHASNVKVTDNSAISTKGDITRIWLQSITGGSASNNVADTYALASNSSFTTSGNTDLRTSPTVRANLIKAITSSGSTLNDYTLSGVGYQASHTPTNTGGSVLTPPAPAPSTPVTTPTPTTPVVTKPETPATPPPPASNSAKYLLDMSFDGSEVSDQSSYHTKFTGNFRAADVVSTAAGAAYHLTGNNSFGAIRGADAQIFGLNTFTLSFSLKRDSANLGTGDIMRIHYSWRMFLDRSGALGFEFRDKNNKVQTYTIPGTKLTDTDWHDIDVSFDATKNTVSFFVDTKQVGQTAIATGTKPIECWSFYVGNPYGTSMTGQIADLSIRNQALSATQIAAESASASASVTSAAKKAVPVTASAASEELSAFAPQTLASTLSTETTSTASNAKVLSTPLTSAEIFKSISPTLGSRLSQLYHG